LALEIGIVGLPSSGKTMLFNALTHGHAAPAGDYGKQHVGIAQIADERLERIADVIGSAKVTPAVVRVLDVPGMGAAPLGHLREADAVLAVVDGFSAVADPARDVEALRLELLVADRDHVERRLERVAKQAKSGEPKLKQEVAALERLLAHVDAGNSLADYGEPLPLELEPLTTKPIVVVENGPNGIDAKLEAELAELPDEEAAEFRDGPPAPGEILRRLFSELDLITFYTANENEARAWTLRRGKTSLDAAGSVHSDMARGFIRCEVIRESDLVECGSRAEAARRGLQRLEGKTYVVQDGDVLNVRFNV
jgi:hypothetical protein